MNASGNSKHVRLVSIFIVALATCLAALMSLSNTAYAQVVPQPPFGYLCHATGASSWETVNVGPTGEEAVEHFGNHPDDIIPPMISLGNLSGQNWDAEHWSTWTNNCVKLLEPAITSVDPVQPIFVEATCDAGPYATFPGELFPVTYSWDVTPAPGVTVTFLATLPPNDYLQWGDIGLWVPTSDPRVLTQSYMFVAPDCPTPTLTVAPTGAATDTPTSAETPTVIATSTAMPIGTPSAVSPPSVPTEPPVPVPPVVVGLPDTGAGGGGSPVGIILDVAALGVMVFGAIAITFGNRKRTRIACHN